ncbi:hypothetical protein COLINT_02982 [Collinsella intestinalis DSM 13280]|uniref:Uncharacterized protein n=1 Tax=Collinsella intestinalis DSM 13280 TaxID=521003 RepID=C4FA91_9ACTN|nr:hypothetical protein COLINT_02982 [Collinsella intestinalis DSM 13280]
MPLRRSGNTCQPIGTSYSPSCAYAEILQGFLAYNISIAPRSALTAPIRAPRRAPAMPT